MTTQHVFGNERMVHHMSLLEKFTRLFALSTVAASAVFAFAVSAAAAGATNGGGGGYVSDNSKALLAQTSHMTGRALRQATPIIFKNLPRPWTKEKLADIIEKVRLSPLRTNQRDGNDLMFDYGVDQSGPYIEALQPYFEMYGSVPVRFETDDTLRKITMDLELKLLHEVGHLFGLDETNADKFAVNAFKALDFDFIYCTVQTSLNNKPAITDALLVQRSSGIADFVYPYKDGILAAISDASAPLGTGRGLYSQAGLVAEFSSFTFQGNSIVLEEIVNTATIGVGKQKFEYTFVFSDASQSVVQSANLNKPKIVWNGLTGVIAGREDLPLVCESLARSVEF
jgi:hypothetical protein